MRFLLKFLIIGSGPGFHTFPLSIQGTALAKPKNALNLWEFKGDIILEQKMLDLTTK